MTGSAYDKTSRYFSTRNFVPKRTERLWYTLCMNRDDQGDKMVGKGSYYGTGFHALNIYEHRIRWRVYADRIGNLNADKLGLANENVSDSLVNHRSHTPGVEKEQKMLVALFLGAIEWKDTNRQSNSPATKNRAKTNSQWRRKINSERTRRGKSKNFISRTSFVFSPQLKHRK